MTANSGPVRSPNGTPLRTGASPSLPDICIRPLNAWKIVSSLPGSSAPNPLIDVYTSRSLTSAAQP
jgi:hypothetical protein